MEWTTDFVAVKYEHNFCSIKTNQNCTFDTYSELEKNVRTDELTPKQKHTSW